NIVDLKGAYEDRHSVNLVMELCEGGELFDRIIAKGHYSERAAAGLCRQMVMVVHSCHSMGVMRRDLKPENFLFLSKDENSALKATDNSHAFLLVFLKHLTINWGALLGWAAVKGSLEPAVVYDTIYALIRTFRCGGAMRKEPKPQEYLEEKRNLQDLWKAAYPVGTEWKLLDGVYEHSWDFKHVEEALEEGGMLYGKRVYVFVITEPHLLDCRDVSKVVLVPVVIAVDSPFPPSDKIGITSVQKAAQEIVPMKQMKMDWVPYIPFEERDRQVERIESQIFILACTQRRAALRHLEEARVSLETLAKDVMDEEGLSAERKDEFKEFVKEQVRAAKRAQRQARARRVEVIQEMSQEYRQAFQSIRFYKFYPQPPPDVSGLVKLPLINRYYGNAHHVF
ncbi:unnamed protein product, partial [Thlaspi arvense]